MAMRVVRHLWGLLLISLLTGILPVQAEELVLPPLRAISDPLWTQPEVLPVAEVPATPLLQSTVSGDQAAGDYADILGKKVMRWNDQTLNILVHIEDGQGLPDWNPDNIRAVKSAFSEWEAAMGGRFRFLYMPDHRGTDVIVSWKGRHEAGDRGHEAGLNRTITWGKYIQENNIELYLHQDQGYVYSPDNIQSLALHEIGHMLGIKGHSNNREDVMYPEAQFEIGGPAEHLSQRDINTMRVLYTRKPDYTNPENVRLSNFDQFKKTHPGRKFRILWVMIGYVPVPIPLPF